MLASERLPCDNVGIHAKLASIDPFHQEMELVREGFFQRLIYFLHIRGGTGSYICRLTELAKYYELNG